MLRIQLFPENHVEKGEYEIATEKYDKTLEALKKFDVRLISCTDEKIRYHDLFG